MNLTLIDALVGPVLRWSIARKKNKEDASSEEKEEEEKEEEEEEDAPSPCVVVMGRGRGSWMHRRLRSTEDFNAQLDIKNRNYQ